LHENSIKNIVDNVFFDLMVYRIMVKNNKLVGVLLALLILLTTNQANGYLLNISYTDLNGNQVSYGIYEGKLLLIEAFSTTCPACQDYHPTLDQIHDTYGSDINMVSVSIDTDDTIATVSQYKSDYPTNWPIGLDPTTQLASIFKIEFTPTTLLLNQEGRLLSTKVGAKPYAEISSMVSGYLAISNPQPSDSVNIDNGGDDSGSVIEDLFGSNLFRIVFFSILVIMIYVKASGSKTV
jgi:thiol-disulfide isomerase/thioredoxin